MTTGKPPIVGYDDGHLVRATVPPWRENDLQPYYKRLSITRITQRKWRPGKEERWRVRLAGKPLGELERRSRMKYALRLSHPGLRQPRIIAVGRFEAACQLLREYAKRWGMAGVRKEFGDD